MLLGWHLTAAVEWDAYCQRVLSARFPDVPCHSDVRDFHPVPDSCDIVTGGFPCQPFSQAGKRLGEDDPRNMWPHAVRVLRESGAPLGFFENVPGLLSSGYFGTVLGDLAEAGFDAEWCVLGADDVGAPHRRKRLWILAYSASHLRRASGDDGRVAPDGAGDRGAGSPWRFDPADVGDGFGAGLEERQGESGDDGAQQSAAERTGGAQRVEAWLTLTGLGGTSHGLAASLDRISGS
jgi:DNA (cytosine-5)-methyltransferase 1